MQRYRFVMARLWLYNAETDPAIVDEIAERYAARSGKTPNKPQKCRSKRF